MKQIKFICIYTRTWAVYLKIVHLSANIFRMSNILLLIVVFQFIKKTCSFLPIDRKMIWWYIFISIINVVQEAVHNCIFHRWFFLN